MRRRNFLKGIVGLAAAWPLAVRAQQPAMPVIGYLSGATFETMRDYVAAFHRGLAEAGFAEGRNVAIEYRWAEEYDDRLPALATDLVSRQVAVIAASTTPSALALKAVTQKVPIVFVVGTDPVKVGLVTSLAQPGGNITGVTVLNVELIAKSLELMHDVMPTTTIAVLINPTNVRQAATERGIVQDTARGLMSYGSDMSDAYRRVGFNTGRILKGDKPADLPVQQATKIEMVINLKIARGLGLTIPLPLLGRADEVIE